MTCNCCSGKCQKSGRYKNRNRIVQRFFCVRCGKSFSEEQPISGIRLEVETVSKVAHMLVEGVGVRAISRMLEIDSKTVLRIIESIGEHCASVMDSKMRNLSAEFVQVDEVYSFVECLPHNCHLDDFWRGEQYLFLSMEQKTKLVFNWLVGKRNGENAVLFLRDLKGRINNRFQLTTDGFSAYLGHIGGVRAVFGNEIDYGIETKFFAADSIHSTSKGNRRGNPVKCQWVKRTPQIGQPDTKRMTTNHAERNNLNVRLFNRRFTRRTLGYSKTLENHNHVVALSLAYHNFCRPHSSLKIAGIDGAPSVQQTPAMAHHLTDHIWSVKELLTCNI